MGTGYGLIVDILIGVIIGYLLFGKIWHKRPEFALVKLIWRTALCSRIRGMAAIWPG